MKVRFSKIVKVILGILGAIISVILVFLLTLCLINLVTSKKEITSISNAYGKMVNVNGENMCVDIKGNGDKVIVLLPGYASTSPVLEFKALVEILKKDYTVVTIEPFGYGLSAQTKKERTMENIVEEIHTAISELGYNKYTIMAHSLSGLYSVYYANKYPSEVQAFVGIDSTVPKQAQYEESADSMVGQYRLQRFLYKSGIIRFIAMLDSEGIVPTIKNFTYSEEEIQVYKKLFLTVPCNNTSLEELKKMDSNFKKVQEVRFPNNIPVLFFLSSQNCQDSEKWYEVHEDVITDKEHSKIVTLDGTHYLHFNYSAEIGSEFKDWIINGYDNN